MSAGQLTEEGVGGGHGGQRSKGLVGPETINLCLSISFALQYLKMKIKPFQSFINSSTNFFLKVSGLKISSFLFLNVLNHPVSSRFDSTLSLPGRMFLVKIQFSIVLLLLKLFLHLKLKYFFNELRYFLCLSYLTLFLIFIIHSIIYNSFFILSFRIDSIINYSSYH